MEPVVVICDMKANSVPASARVGGNCIRSQRVECLDIMIGAEDYWEGKAFTPSGVNFNRGFDVYSWQGHTKELTQVGG